MTEVHHEVAMRSKLISGVKWATAVRIASQAITWLVTLAMVRLLSPHDYGLNAMIEVPIELLFLFSTLGLDAAIIRLGKNDSKQLASAFGYLLILNFLFFVALMLGAESLANYFKEPQLKLLIQVTAVIFALAPFRTIPNALLDMALDFKLKSQVEFAASITASIVALGLALLGAGVWALVSVVVLGAVLRAVLLAYHRPWVVRPSLAFLPVKESLRYGVVVIAGAAVGVIAGRALTFLAGPHIGAEVLGYFAVATVFAMLPMSKVMPIVQQTMFPAMAKLSGDKALSKIYLLKSLEIAALVIYPLSVGTACLAPQVVGVIFGDKWSTIALPLAILAMMTPVRLINQIFWAPLNAQGRAKAVALIQAVTLCVLGSGAIYAAQFGIMGMVWLTGVALVFTSSVSLYIGNKAFGTKLIELANAVGPAVISCAVMAMVLLVGMPHFQVANPIARLILETMVGAAIYTASCWFLFKPRMLFILKAFKN